MNISIGLARPTTKLLIQHLGQAHAAGDLRLVQGVSTFLCWIVFGLSLVVMTAYLIVQNNKNPDNEKRKWWEILLATISFVVWGLTVRGPLRQTLGVGWKPVYENLIVLAWTLIPPYFIQGT